MESTNKTQAVEIDARVVMQGRLDAFVSTLAKLSEEYPKENTK